jgi:signal peptidase I
VSKETENEPGEARFRAQTKSALRSAYDVAVTALWAIALALIIRTFAFEPFRIPSGSMLPGLWVGDYLFVSKYSYGYSRYAFPLGASTSSWNPFAFAGRILDSAPARGDVVVFRQPRDPSVDYIKRVIGLPGDRIQIKERTVYLNGKPLARERLASRHEQPLSGGGIGEPGHPGSADFVEAFRETMPGGRAYVIWQKRGTEESLVNNTDEFVVPAGHYFMMGDNRDDSNDSRSISAVGFVPTANLIGRAEILFFSTDHRAELWQVHRWPASIRFSRFFKRIQ